MIRHMMSAPICTKSLAAWKMIVFAASIVREKHFASIPGQPPEPSYGPTNVHSGIGDASHMDWKLPKDIAAVRRGGVKDVEERDAAREPLRSNLPRAVSPDMGERERSFSVSFWREQWSDYHVSTSTATT